MSVVVPTRDRRDLVMDAVTSVLEQRAVTVEVIVVVDGSRDGTEAAVAGRGDPRLRAVTLPVSGGVSRARNEGLRRARGEWIAFLDDDDLWSPTLLEAALGAMRAEDAEAALSGWCVVDRERRYLGAKAPPEPRGVPAALRDFCAVGPPSCVVLRTEDVRAAGGFDVQFSVLADWDLWLRTLTSARIAAVPEPHVAYTIHTGNMQTRQAGEAVRERDRLRAKHGAHIGSLDFDRWLASRMVTSRRRLRGMRMHLAVALRSGRASDVREAYRAGPGELVARARGWTAEPPSEPGPEWLARWAGES